MIRFPGRCPAPRRRAPSLAVLRRAPPTRLRRSMAKAQFAIDGPPRLNPTCAHPQVEVSAMEPDDPTARAKRGQSAFGELPAYESLAHAEVPRSLGCIQVALWEGILS